MLNEQLAQLPHLVGFGVSPLWLQGNDLGQVRHFVDVVTSPDSLIETEGRHQRSEIAKADVGVCLAAQDPSKQSLMAVQRTVPSLVRYGCPGRT